ncbi:MAG: ABC transporter substrate-binding protein, partial [Phycisphaerales bacterium]
IIWTLLGTMVVAMFGCGDGRPEVVAYVSADDYVARPILEAFEEKHGVRVLVRYDTEATKTTGLVNRIRAEADRPAADLLWSSEPFMMAQLAEEGLLMAPPADRLTDWPEAWRDPERRWHAFSGRARVIVYAPDRVPAERVPRTWMDLTRPWWKDRIVMADPRFGTTRGHLGAMKRTWDREVMPGYYEAFLEGLAENGIRLLPGGNAAVVEAVASGEADVGLTDTDDVWVMQDRGVEVELVYPRHAPDKAPGGGTLVVPNTAAIVRGGPNPDGAVRLLEFLLSKEAEVALMRTASRNAPLVHLEALEGDAAVQAAALEVPDPRRIDYGRASKSMDEAVAIAMRILTAPPVVPIGREADDSEDEADAGVEAAPSNGDGAAGEP